MGELSGKRALAEIEDALAKARGGLSSLDAEFSAASTELARLELKEVGVLTRLAKLRLLALEQGEVVQALDDADRRAAQILDEREAAAAALANDLAAAEAARADAEARRAGQRRRVEAALGALDEAEAKAQARLETDAAYGAQLERTERTDAVADQAEEKAAAARRDRNEKGRPYEHDPLFSYLWARGYGTSAYRAWPLARWLDGRVARRCGYEAARRNYAMLIEIPKRLDEHAAKMRGRFDGEVEALRELEQQAAAACGVPDLRAALEAAEKALAEVDAEIAATEDRIRALVDERGRFASGDDDYYRRCIDVLGAAMRKRGVRFLQERASKTLDREDDALAERLAELGRDRERVEQDLAQFRRLHKAERRRLHEFEDVHRRFKRRGFDDPHSYFANGALLGIVLGRFLSGLAGAGDVWDVVERQQRHRPAHSHPKFGTMRFPRAPKPGPWRMPRGGGFGGGGFRTGGGFGRGGGFKTGGGF